MQNRDVIGKSIYLKFKAGLQGQIYQFFAAPHRRWDEQVIPEKFSLQVFDVGTYSGRERQTRFLWQFSLAKLLFEIQKYKKPLLFSTNKFIKTIVYYVAYKRTNKSCQEEMSK